MVRKITQLHLNPCRRSLLQARTSDQSSPAASCRILLRSEMLSQRKRALDRLYRGSRVPFLHQVEAFKDGEVLFDYCNRFGFEGVVSKRQQSGYASGSTRWWVKVKCPHWKRANSERWRVFETEGK